jgi:hypothetical protein
MERGEPEAYLRKQLVKRGWLKGKQVQREIEPKRRFLIARVPDRLFVASRLKANARRPVFRCETQKPEGERAAGVFFR